MARYRRHISILLMMVYAFFFASTNFFYHSHQFTDYKIVHSHPFAGHGHSHTAGQILLINSIDSTTYQESSITSVPDFLPIQLGGNYFIPDAEFVFQPSIFTFSLRAPPAAC